MTTENNSDLTNVSKPKWDSVHGIDVLIGVPILWGVELFLVVGCKFFFSGKISANLTKHSIDALLISGILAVATLIVTWTLVCWKYHKSFCEGFLITRVSRRVVLISLLISVGYALIALLLINKFSTGKSLIEHLPQTPIGLVVILTLMIVLPPIEELYYRGFLFPALQKSWGSIVAVFVVIIWFAVSHGVQWIHDPISILIITLAGAIWTIQRLVTASLTVSLISHLTYNYCIILAAILLLMKPR